MTKDILQFTGGELISEVLDQMPEAQEVFAAHGLSCAGCYINVYETVEQGVMGHGMSEENLNRLLEDLNEAAKMLELQPGKVSKNPVLTAFSKEKILEFQKEQASIGHGFKVQVEGKSGDFSYFLDFLEKPEKGDIVIESLGINLFLDQDSLKKLQNHTIDFGVNDNGDEGFKIEKNENDL